MQPIRRLQLLDDYMVELSDAAIDCGASDWFVSDYVRGALDAVYRTRDFNPVPIVNCVSLLRTLLRPVTSEDSFDRSSRFKDISQKIISDLPQLETAWQLLYWA